MEDFSSDDECLDVTLKLPVVTNDLTDQESDSEGEVNALSETPPEVSQNRMRFTWKTDTNTPIVTPCIYFSVYFIDGFLEKATEYTNKYHIFEKDIPLGASVAEMKIFLVSSCYS